MPTGIQDTAEENQNSPAWKTSHGRAKRKGLSVLYRGLAAKNRRPLAVTLPKGVNALSLPSLTELGELVSAHRGSGRV